MKILILGGYGVFGGRLVELLSDTPELTLLVCGRNEAKAAAFCRSVSAKATLFPLGLDRAEIAEALETHTPDIVVDASGPFQQYRGDPYGVVSACIAARTHYLDFADAADFVFGVSQFDAAAKAAGVAVLSGVSSFPVLTAAVLRELSNGMTMTTVKGGIAPSPYAGIGLNVMRAVVSYAGGPVKLVRNGHMTTARGLCESMRYTIAPPGRLPLRNIHFSLVDVPDLQVLPAEVVSIKDIWMGAGPAPEILHRVLNVLAKLRSGLSLPSLEPLSPLFYRVLNLMKFGEHRGGMFVHVEGLKEGKPYERSWHLLAEGDDGPYIPSMAIEALIRKWLKGETPAPGARPATRALTLADYDLLFQNRAIYWGVREQPMESQTLYQRILGPAFDCLPQQLQKLHGKRESRIWTGEAKVEAGQNFFSRFVAAFFGFPQIAGYVNVEVNFRPDETGEVWERNFNGKIFRSYQEAGTGKNECLLTERFGAVTVGLALVIKDSELHLIPRRWTFFGLPLPSFLLPNGASFECEKDGVFNFNVTIKAPIIGRIVAYQGWLKPRE